MKKISLFLLLITLVVTVTSCNKNETSNPVVPDNQTGDIETSETQTEVKKTLAPKVAANAVQLYGLQKSPYMMQQVLNPLLQPFWNTREVYNETFLIIGKEGEVKLLYAPTEILFIKDYCLKTTYVKGVDFTINGNILKRTPNSSMPYLEADEYWVDEATKNANTIENINFQIVPEGSKGPKEFGLTGQRYLKIRENILPEYSQCVISYKHNDPFPTD